MRTHIEFLSNAFPPYESEEEQINPGRYGKRLAEFLAEGLKKHQFQVTAISPEDWGWMIKLKNESFPLWVGCGNYEEFENGFLCFIAPSKPILRKWFKKIKTIETVEKLASAIESTLQQNEEISKLRWWSEVESRT